MPGVDLEGCGQYPVQLGKVPGGCPGGHTASVPGIPGAPCAPGEAAAFSRHVRGFKGPPEIPGAPRALASARQRHLTEATHYKGIQEDPEPRAHQGFQTHPGHTRANPGQG